MMNKICEIVQDLIPLYIDEICSPSSQQMVDDHIKECTICNNILLQMKNSNITDRLSEETTNVIETQAKKFKRTSALIGTVIAGIIMIPIIICLIANLVTGHGLTWFFIVLAAMLLAASLIVVPLVVPDNKAIWTLASGVGSLILLLAICCIYSRGKWFFIAVFAVLFGLSIVFGPFAVRSKLFKAYIDNKKGLVYFGIITLLFFIMMIFIGIHVGRTFPWIPFFMIALPLWATVWMIFLSLRYLPLKKSGRFGVASIILGFMIIICDIFIYTATEMSMGYYNGLSIPGLLNPEWIIFGILVLVGIILLVVNFIKKGDR